MNNRIKIIMNNPYLYDIYHTLFKKCLNIRYRYIINIESEYKLLDFIKDIYIYGTDSELSRYLKDDDFYIEDSIFNLIIDNIIKNNKDVPFYNSNPRIIISKYVLMTLYITDYINEIIILIRTKKLKQLINV